MIKYRDTASLKLSPSVVCLGFFDGVHLGHQAIITQGLRLARESDLQLCVHTYDIPPEQLLKRNGGEFLQLTGEAEKARLLEALGVDALVTSAFNESLMRMTGQDFFENILLKRLNARHVVAGFDHRFGHRGDTDTAALQRMGAAAGVGVTIVPAVTTLDGQTISSTAIREALRRGDRQLAEAMLGRPPT